MPCGGHAWPGEACVSGGHVWQGAMHGRGVCMAEGMCCKGGCVVGRHACQAGVHGSQ